MKHRKEPENLIYFQNLVPGKQDSPFIDQYQEQCLTDSDEDNERRDLLNQNPPVLSFYEQQKKKFYEEQAKSCNFCCGNMISSPNAAQEQTAVSLAPTDYYIYSKGSGNLYEGSSANINKQLKDDINQAQVGSPDHQQRTAEMNQFNTIVSQRENNPSTNVGSEFPVLTGMQVSNTSQNLNTKNIRAETKENQAQETVGKQSSQRDEGKAEQPEAARVPSSLPTPKPYK